MQKKIKCAKFNNSKFINGWKIGIIFLTIHITVQYKCTQCYKDYDFYINAGITKIWSMENSTILTLLLAEK